MLDTATFARSRAALNDQQFGETADRYVQSAVHAGGDDLRQIGEIARKLEGAKVIDLGCGGGHVAYTVAPFVQSVVAYDLSADMLAAVDVDAKKRGIGNLTTTRGPAETLPFADGSFDAVFSRFSTHHWPDVRQGLREARRVLRRGGVAVFADAVAPEQPVLDTFLQTFEMLRDPSHVRDYSSSEWVGFAAEAGFKVVGVTRRMLPLEFVPWLQRQRTPPVMSEAIKALFGAVSDDVRAHFAIRDNFDFAIDTAVFEFAPL